MTLACELNFFTLVCYSIFWTFLMWYSLVSFVINWLFQIPNLKFTLFSSIIWPHLFHFLKVYEIIWNAHFQWKSWEVFSTKDRSLKHTNRLFKIEIYHINTCAQDSRLRIHSKNQSQLISWINGMIFSTRNPGRHTHTHTLKTKTP